MKIIRLLSVLLVVCMLMSCLSISASAAVTVNPPVAVNRQAIYQSLDFGPFTVDFPDGAIIDNMQYQNGETFDRTGDYTLYYSEDGSNYKRPLYLYKMGDVNCDNTVDVIDLVVLKKVLAKTRTLNQSGTHAADFNLNGRTNATDAVQLKRSLLTSNGFPVTAVTDVADTVDFTVNVESGRDIRVLQLTDPQIIEKEQMRPGRGGVADRWSRNNKDAEYHNYVRKVIEEYDPDLIIMTGDIVYGEFDDSGASLQEFISFMDGFRIPWAPVFGNHDQESAKGADWQCDQLEASPYCLFKQRTLTGNGNYTVGVKQDGVYKRVFFMLDSNGCGSAHANSVANGHTKTTAGFEQDQIDWYTKQAEKIRYAEPTAHLSAAFHIQFYAFADAFKQYGFTNSGTTENPINIDTIEDAAETDFGYLGRDLKGPWDNERNVFYGMKAAGFDSFFVGHEHCNSVSVMYRGIRFQYGLKSSTYDRANYLNADGTVTGTFDKPMNPIVGGTAIPLNADGSLGQPYCIYYEASSAPIPPEPLPEPIGSDIYDFNDVDFDTGFIDTGICASGYVCSKMNDPSAAPGGSTGDVYARNNCNSSGMATVPVDLGRIDVSKIKSLKVRMYVPSHSLTSGKTALLRLFSGEVYDGNLQFESTYSAVGGKYNQWVEIDLLPLIRSRSGANSGNPLIVNNILGKFFIVYRFYSPDTSAMCYFDSIIIEYTDPGYRLD